MQLPPPHTAVLTLDFQQGILQRVPGAHAAVPPAARAVAAARRRGLRVIHVGLGFAAGHPEVAEQNALFSAIKERDAFTIGSPTAAFHTDIVDAGELVLYKQRIGAFSENQLHLILRAQRIDHLVFFGVSTSGIVLSTLRRAFDLDFRCVVIKDACFDDDPEVHRVLTEKVFPRQATVVTVDEFCADQRLAE